MKQYLIFLVIFTILYILFFVLFDSITSKVSNNKITKKVNSLINYNTYISFASFYGITATATLEVLHYIYEHYKNLTTFSIIDESVKFGLSQYEFCVIILYLEYVGLFNKKTINYTAGTASTVSFDDATLADKYSNYFNNKYDYNTICSLCGANAPNELMYLNNCFLIPGVRIINSVLYYVGDLK